MIMAPQAQRQPDKKDLELENLRDNRRYRFRALLGDNWPADDIMALVYSEHHPSYLEDKLLKKGCPPRTAVRILI